MNDSQDQRGLIKTRAQRRYPDYQIVSVYPVCWPVFRLRLSAIVLAQHKLSATAGIVLRLSNLGVRQPAEFCRMMGLPAKYLVGAAAELLEAGLVAQRPDLGLEITSQGKQAVNDGGQSSRPQPRPLVVPYDPLTKRVLDMDIAELKDRDYVGKNALFVIPCDGRKPRLSELRLDQIQGYAGHDLDDAEQVLEVSEVRDRDSVLRYRDDYMVAKLIEPNTNQPVFAVYRSQQYLQEETDALSRLAQDGHNLVPEEYEPVEEHSPWNNSPSVTPEEAEHLTAIEELDLALDTAKQAVSEARAADYETLSGRDRDALLNHIGDLEKRILDLSEELAARENRLDALTQGATRVIRSEQHRNLLLEAIDKASSELVLVSAWIRPEAFNDELRRKLVDAISRGVEVRIAWGFGTDANARMSAQKRDAATRSRNWGEDVIDRLRRMIRDPKMQEKLLVRRTDTHQKFIICDDRFCVVGSFNWLSYRGRGPRWEASHYSERPEDISIWKDQAARLFQ